MNTQAISSPQTLREYGRKGLVGILIPQANTVVEPELAALLPGGFTMLSSRLTGSRTDSRTRLTDYFGNLGHTLDSFDTAPLDAAGYACTGSSYLIDPELEQRRLDALQMRHGYPVVTASQAIKSAFAHLGIRRIALVSPYPAWMTALCQAYWAAAGIDVADTAVIDLDTADTRAIYAITTPTVLAAFDALRWQDADAVLFSGTGMPTLPAIQRVAALTGKPVLSSNLCLAWELLRVTGNGQHLPPPDATQPLFGGWAERVPGQGCAHLDTARGAL